MSVALSLSISGLKSRNRTNHLFVKIQAKMVLIGLIATGLLLALLALYFTQINTLTAKSDRLNELKQDLSRLQERNRQLDFQAATLQSQPALAEKI